MTEQPILIAGGVAAGVVDLAPTGRPLVARVVRHVRLEADDRLDVDLAARLVEVEDAVHVAVVGDADRRLTVGRGCGDRVGDTRRAVEHRELGVDMEVGERVAHGRGLLRNE